MRAPLIALEPSQCFCAQLHAERQCTGQAHCSYVLLLCLTWHTSNALAALADGLHEYRGSLQVIAPQALHMNGLLLVLPGSPGRAHGAA